MLPLPSQLAMLRLEAQNPGSEALRIEAAWRTSQRVDEHALVRAAAGTLDETEVAGLGMIHDGDGAVGLVPAERAAIDVRAFDTEHEYRAWRELPAPMSDGAALVRIAVARVGAEYVFVIRAHHALLDGYGLELLARRVVERYPREAAGLPLPHAGLGSLAALAAQVASPLVPDLAFWSGATEGVGQPGREIAFTPRSAPPAARPLLHRESIRIPGLHERAAWPSEAVGTVGAYTARYLGTTDARIGVVSALRRTPAQRSTPVQWMAVVPLRLEVLPDSTPAGLGGRVTRWLAAAGERVAAGERPEELLTALPAAWRTGRLYGPAVNVLPYVRHEGWTVDVGAWGPVEDCLFNIWPGPDDEVVVEGAFHPDLYTAERARGHVEALTALLTVSLASPFHPFAVIPKKPIAADRIAVPGGWISPAELQGALADAGFTPDETELLTTEPVTVVLRGVAPHRLLAARAVLPPGVRLRVR
ncbi:hypothetical protein [Tsukamurella pseudospumae]|uniref:Condensation domain-containing protein n=1 Tax=Tsukamurella pseudospumae TaxID=239498 RepID=A0A137ZSV6_9ACTN|nr:hypothetical protein [Tsukamurella pseudospumae]KXP01257.1 hypothetical protein AXK61_00080 [Tsukamurella pseudospumae]